MTEAKYDFSGGDFRGAIMNFESTVTQYIGSNPNIKKSQKDELNHLIKELSLILKDASDDKAEETEAVAATAKHLVEISTSDNPNKSMIQITSSGLKQAAQSIADVVPTVIGVVTKNYRFRI